MWNNKYIQLPTKPKKKTFKSLFWVNIYQAGIVKVRDIVSNDGSFIDLTDFCRNHDVKYNFIQIIRMRKAIPKEWINIIAESASHNTQVLGHRHNLILKTDGLYTDILKKNPPQANRSIDIL